MWGGAGDRNMWCARVGGAITRSGAAVKLRYKETVRKIFFFFDHFYPNFYNISLRSTIVFGHVALLGSM